MNSGLEFQSANTYLHDAGQRDKQDLELLKSSYNAQLEVSKYVFCVHNL